MESMSTSGSETDDEGAVEGAFEGDASESVAVAGLADDTQIPTTTKKRVVMTRRERNEGMRSSLTVGGGDGTTRESDEEHDEPQPFMDRPIRTDMDDAAALADKIGCSRAAVRAIRLNKVALPSLLAADAQLLTSIGIEAEDQERLLKALRATNREKWEASSVIAPPSSTSEDLPPFTLSDMCSMLSNSTLHLNCIASGLVDAQRVVHQHRQDKLLNALGYQDAQNLKELKNLIRIMKSSTATVGVQLDELSLALDGKGASAVKSSSDSGTTYYTLFGLCALTTVAFVFFRLQRQSV